MAKVVNFTLYAFCLYFGHLMQKANSLEKNPDAGKESGQEEKRATEGEMVGWHH